MLRRAVLLAAAALALTACDVNPPDPYGEGTLAEGVLVSRTGSPGDMAYDAPITSYDNTDLRTPHADVQLIWSMTAPGLTDRDAGLADGPPGRAPAGHEVIAVYLRPVMERTDVEQFFGGERPVAHLVIGDKATPVDKLPYVHEPTYTPYLQDPYLIVATAPKDARVTLRITDGDLVVSLDLRTGKPVPAS
ncbi:hypothetical protein Afil01_27420 [Actinorhabdospora filicis]|uniref:Lipoprotein n=1 Tax=Actinorhabdospora filicis TaxID=1785913 RepID=A0A9W6SIZ0_9ACTN|nr:hypothetical protein [Actinorhabdospora filicis]GLZ77935.1 hypothetical protein Afil01_27420 [Actinorhabdospora filicis]